MEMNKDKMYHIGLTKEDKKSVISGTTTNGMLSVSHWQFYW